MGVIAAPVGAASNHLAPEAAVAARLVRRGAADRDAAVSALLETANRHEQENASL